MKDEQKKKIMPTWATNAYVCVDPEVGEDVIDEYQSETLAEEAREAFDAHLPFCEKCQQELAYAQWALSRLAKRVTVERVLPSIELTDFCGHRIQLDYAESPLFGQMAAAGHPEKPLEFPISMTYAYGAIRMRGEWWLRGGTLLTYRMVECQPEETCVLTYTMPNSNDEKRLVLSKDEEVELFDVNEIGGEGSSRRIVEMLQKMRITVCSH
ncbi:hypothetical protein U14_01839 [Candidatus Moduliflexus flocculans]|uniref:Zinc-finger domain-containing protein n=1 Tax=Candidatus Moduliflexus flocculans TaxID=1499966 RepID=A0A0S6VZH5_9BACT|nr:hypothetical protein U14_01839 [Candidatus Moduliflexus flocculans]